MHIVNVASQNKKVQMSDEVFIYLSQAHATVQIEATLI